LRLHYPGRGFVRAGGVRRCRKKAKHPRDRQQSCDEGSRESSRGTIAKDARPRNQSGQDCKGCREAAKISPSNAMQNSVCFGNAPRLLVADHVAPGGGSARIAAR
jgi:hypothetical protein